MDWLCALQNAILRYGRLQIDYKSALRPKARPLIEPQPGCAFPAGVSSGNSIAGTVAAGEVDVSVCAVETRGSADPSWLDDFFACAGCACFSGRMIRNVAPWPGLLSAEIEPPCREMILRHSDSPMPEPSYSVRLWRRWNTSKIVSRYFSSNPMPLSWTLICHRGQASSSSSSNAVAAGAG